MDYINIQINPKSAVPVYEQVKRGIKLAILSGNLKEGDKLISIREFAVKLKINPNTIVKVYYQLEVEGFIISRAGTGYFVAPNAEKSQQGKQELFKMITEDYIAAATDIGYSIQDIMAELKTRSTEIEDREREEKNDKD